MKIWTGDYRKYFAASLGAHVLLLVFFLLSIETGFNDNQLPAKPGEIVQAVIVDQKKVSAEVERLKTQENQEKLAAEQAQKQQDQKLLALKHEQALEQSKLEKLKQDMARAKQEEQDRLAELKLVKEKETKQLEALKQEHEKEKKQLAALDDQRQAEQDRVKNMRQEREKEEKKGAALQKQQVAKQQAIDAKAAQEAERVAKLRQGFITDEVQKILGIWAEKIRENKREAYGMPANLFCKLAISVLPDGNVQVRLVESSGNTAYDDLSIKAVYKSQPFALPEDPDIKARIKSFDLGLKNDEGVE